MKLYLLLLWHEPQGMYEESAWRGPFDADGLSGAIAQEKKLHGLGRSAFTHHLVVTLSQTQVVPARVAPKARRPRK